MQPSEMYNSIWLEEQEVHVHRFLWRDSPEDEIEDYAVVRVNMGDKPAGCIAQVAMRETAMLPQFSDMKEERRVIDEDSYVDDLLTSHNDPHCLNEILGGVEYILKAGGFYLKPWVRSGQSGRRDGTESKPVTLTLPNQLREEDNKALGVGYLVQEDKLFVMVSINFSRRKKKMRTETDLTEGEVEVKTPNPLTRRVLLSQIAGLYDPIGLVTPVKQKGVILVRRAFQEAGKLTKDTWDEPLSDELRGKAIELFKEYARLSRITFRRSLTPSDWKGKPWGITFFWRELWVLWRRTVLAMGDVRWCGHPAGRVEGQVNPPQPERWRSQGWGMRGCLCHTSEGIRIEAWTIGRGEVVPLHWQSDGTRSHPKRELRIPDILCEPSRRDSEGWTCNWLVVDTRRGQHRWSGHEGVLSWTAGWELCVAERSRVPV